MKKTEKSTETKTTRQPYIKPQMEKVQLVPEEAVLVSCKIGGGGGSPFGPNIPDCLPPQGQGQACMELTS